MRIVRLLLVALALTGCGADPASGPASGPASDPAPAAAPVKVMPLGDSITAGFTVPGGYRTALRAALPAGRIDFVGSQHDGPGDLPDQDHEGHRGLRIDEIDAEVTAWVTAAAPRIVLLLVGTNDVIQEYQLAGAPGRLSALVDHILAAAPAADVFVASLIPLETAAWDAHAAELNAALPALLQAKGAKVHLVDMRAAVTVADLQDGIHPTAAGYAKMARTWAAAITPVLASS